MDTTYDPQNSAPNQTELSSVENEGPDRMWTELVTDLAAVDLPVSFDASPVDEFLLAQYLDGQLTPEEAEPIEQAMRDDVDLADSIAMLRKLLDQDVLHRAA